MNLKKQTILDSKDAKEEYIFGKVMAFFTSLKESN